MINPCLSRLPPVQVRVEAVDARAVIRVRDTLSGPQVRVTSPVMTSDRTVTTAQGGWNYGYGNVVQIDHGNGFVTIYAHLSVISVAKCQSVTAGAPIGAAGNTGNSQGAHLHFEIRRNGSPINPWLLL